MYDMTIVYGIEHTKLYKSMNGEITFKGFSLIAEAIFKLSNWISDHPTYRVYAVNIFYMGEGDDKDER